jgi:hypothetical protein
MRRQDQLLRSEAYQFLLTEEKRQTREQCHVGIQNSSTVVVSQVQAESRGASLEIQPSYPCPEADAQIENGNATALSTATAVDHLLQHNDVLVPNEPAARSISATLDNQPFNTEERQGPADSYDHNGRDGKDEPDYGQIVRDLHRLKQERKMQEQKIEAGRNCLPDVSTLTQSASDARRAADEAQRIADETQRAAETAKKAVEDAEAKQSQLAADELYLEKLTKDSTSLRAQLDID